MRRGLVSRCSRSCRRRDVRSSPASIEVRSREMAARERVRHRHHHHRRRARAVRCPSAWWPPIVRIRATSVSSERAVPKGLAERRPLRTARQCRAKPQVIVKVPCVTALERRSRSPMTRTCRTTAKNAPTIRVQLAFRRLRRKHSTRPVARVARCIAMEPELALVAPGTRNAVKRLTVLRRRVPQASARRFSPRSVRPRQTKRRVTARKCSATASAAPRLSRSRPT